MDRPIRRLPEVVIGRVAAGEVVERPSAVVKELVENSIDAGATEIRVDFRRAGKDFIAVEDNGNAMSRENASLAIERHATSKISSFEDLYAIRSFGFRGEALPSIGSVSRLTLRTKREIDELGTEIVVDDGTMISLRPCAMAKGTAVRVEHLFQSVPARRKFLKTDQTEANHIVEVMRLFALAFPAIDFHLRRDGRSVFSIKANGRLDRIGQMWGKEIASGLRPFDFGEDEIRCGGFISNPDEPAGLARGEMLFFVNGRCIRSNDLRDWVLGVAAKFFQRTLAVNCFIFLEMSPQLIDVNVHPTKMEVRFARRSQLRDILLCGLEKHFSQLRTSPCVPICRSSVANFKESKYIPPKPTARSEVANAAAAKFESTTKACEAPLPEKFREQTCRENSPMTDWRYIAMFDRTRALFNSGNGLVVFDLRAAAVHIAKEKLMREIADCGRQRQRLLVPIVIDLSNLHVDDVEDKLERLAAVGFSIGRSESDKLTISEVPAWIDVRSGEAFIYDWISAKLEVAAPWDAAMAAVAAKRIFSEKLPSCEREMANFLSTALASVSAASALCFEISTAEIDRRLG